MAQFSLPQNSKIEVGNYHKDKTNSKNLKKDYDLIHTLMGNDVALRKDFIVENAINVSNLDV